MDFVYFIQRNVLNRCNSVLEIEAYNESFATRVTVIEKCKYFVSILYKYFYYILYILYKYCTKDILYDICDETISFIHPYKFLLDV